MRFEDDAENEDSPYPWELDQDGTAPWQFEYMDPNEREACEQLITQYKSMEDRVAQFREITQIHPGYWAGLSNNCRNYERKFSRDLMRLPRKSWMRIFIIS